MTLKRKLGIAAVLVLVVIVVALVMTREPPGSMLDVAFIRKDYGKDGGVILISNPHPFEVVCTLSVKWAGGWGTMPTVPRYGMLEVALPAGLSTSWIGGTCQRVPSQSQLHVWRLQEVFGINSTRKKEEWEIAVGLPPSKTLLP